MTMLGFFAKGTVKSSGEPLCARHIRKGCQLLELDSDERYLFAAYLLTKKRWWPFAWVTDWRYSMIRMRDGLIVERDLSAEQMVKRMPRYGYHWLDEDKE